LPVLSINWTTASGIWDDNHKTWEAIRCVNFHFDDSSFQPYHGAGIDFGKHGAKSMQDEGKGKFQIPKLMAQTAPQLLRECYAVNKRLSLRGCTHKLVCIQVQN